MYLVSQFLDVAFDGTMRHFLRLGNQNGEGPQQYVSIPFFDGIRVHIVRYILTMPHPVTNVWIGEFHFASTDNLSSSGGSTSSVMCRLNCSTVPKCLRQKEHPVRTTLCFACMKVERS
jgi:hypothetical protein